MSVSTQGFRQDTGRSRKAARMLPDPEWREGSACGLGRPGLNDTQVASGPSHERPASFASVSEITSARAGIDPSAPNTAGTAV
jgi:hypothetical protein